MNREEAEKWFEETVERIGDHKGPIVAAPGCQRCEKLRELADTAAYEQGRAQRRLLQIQEFYHLRFQALRKWVKEEVQPALPEAAERYWNIVANGKPSAYEPFERLEALEQVQKKLDSLVSDMRDFIDDCAYGDNCPNNAGTRHGTCTSCKARKALQGIGLQP